MTFRRIAEGGLERLVFVPWLERGIVHGFTGVAHDFKEPNLETNVSALLTALHATTLILPHQVHGAAVVDIRRGADFGPPKLHGRLLGSDIDADAVIATVGKPDYVIGTRTADCLPLLVVKGEARAAVHAGWRGLAAGVIASVLERLAPIDAPLEVVVGPCAGRARYEVGEEVVDEIGTDAVVAPSTSGRYLLDLAATAERQFLHGGVPLAFHFAEICTIADPSFHSHRRNPSGRGNNLAYFRL